MSGDRLVGILAPILNQFARIIIGKEEPEHRGIFKYQTLPISDGDVARSEAELAQDLRARPQDVDQQVNSRVISLMLWVYHPITRKAHCIAWPLFGSGKIPSGSSNG